MTLRFGEEYPATPPQCSVCSLASLCLQNFWSWLRPLSRAAVALAQFPEEFFHPMFSLMARFALQNSTEHNWLRQAANYGLCGLLINSSFLLVVLNRGVYRAHAQFQSWWGRSQVCLSTRKPANAGGA